MDRPLGFVFFLSLIAGCANPTTAPDSNDDDVIVPEGKEDDFFATSAKEYFVSGRSTVTLEDTLKGHAAAEKLARIKQLVVLKNVAIGWFLNVYLTDKEDEDANKKYGGFGGLVRFASEENTTPVAIDELTYSFDYKVQVGGSRSLIGKIPGTSVSGKKTFPLAMRKVSNDELSHLEYNHEWYRNYSDFDPKTTSPDLVEKIDLTVVAQKVSSDAYLAYDRLFADGELSVAVHFGWDYHARYDIQGARNLYTWLVGQGFRSPVASFAQLLRDSGPLTKTIVSNKKNVVVKVWIFHPGDASQGVPGPDPDTDAGGKILEGDMRQSFAEREVIVFEGHSGPLYAFALANWRMTDEGDLDDSKIPGLAMKSGYQIVLANGCETYDLGAPFWKNPAKADHANLNVITSTSFSNAGTEASAERLLRALFNQTGNKVVPVKVSELTAGLDDDQGSYFDTMYGVHGVDHNPKFDPTSDAAKLCQTCTSDGSCGADGNRCTKLSSSQKVCTFACIDETGCPTGYACRQVASATTKTLKTKQCVPSSLSCR